MKQQKGEKRRSPHGGRSQPATPLLSAAARSPMRSEVWRRLRQGARNVAGVTYQFAVTVDVLVAGVAARPGHPSVVSVLPEGLEDIDLDLFGGGKLFVQAEGALPALQSLGASAVAEVVVHAALNMLAAGELGGSARIGLVTACTLAAGLVPTGWAATVLDTTAPAALVSLEEAVKERLTTAGTRPHLEQGPAASYVDRVSALEPLGRDAE